MEAAVIGERLSAGFRASLPTGFHSTISTPLKTMQHLKKGMKLGDRTVFDLETVFLRLLTIGQQRQLELADIFKYELCPVPCSLIDEYGCLRRGSKSPLAHKLCVQTQNREVPELVMIDASQLLYHIVWPFRGHVSDIVESIKRRLSLMPGEKILVFDKYHDLSAKDHERVRRAGIGSTKYNLTVNTQLPNHEAIMWNKHSKLVCHMCWAHTALVAMWLLRVTAMASSNMMKLISLWYHTSSWPQILEQSASASSQMTQMCLCCSFIGCIVTVSTPLCRWRDGMDQFGISMPPVPNSLPHWLRYHFISVWKGESVSPQDFKSWWLSWSALCIGRARCHTGTATRSGTRILLFSIW